MMYCTIISDETDPFVIIRCIKTSGFKEPVLNNKGIYKLINLKLQGSSP